MVKVRTVMHSMKNVILMLEGTMEEECLYLPISNPHSSSSLKGRNIAFTCSEQNE